MTAVRQLSTSTDKKSLPNTKLLAVLGLVIVLALVFKVAPGLLGGGAGVTPSRPLATFHLQWPGAATAGKSAPGGPATRPARDPFGAPAGYATPGH
jgi:hypothetical protein